MGRKAKYEYGPNYLALCDRVKKINPDAAKYMRTIPKKRLGGDALCDRLVTSFLFGCTPQGGEFWWDIHLEVEAQKQQEAQLKPSVLKNPKPALRAIWMQITVEIPSKATRQTLVDIVHECVAEINQLGAENANLKNQLAKMKGGEG